MKRLVIDCDPGIDDAQAIMMAFMYPQAEIEAITTVSGNVDVEKTTVNALKILDILDAGPIPVFPGARFPLVGKTDNASKIHGLDGLGDINLPDSDRTAQKAHASIALSKLAKENPGKLSLIAIGPLTNLALALQLDPELPYYYKELVIMGGAYTGKGNSKVLTSEFNFYTDPEAAKYVLDRWPVSTAVTWETTLAHGIPEAFLEYLTHYPNNRSEFLSKILRKQKESFKRIKNKNISFAADPLAMAVILEPEIVEESLQKYMQIECLGCLTRGMTVIDWWDSLQKAPNVNIIQKVNQERFQALMKLTFK